MAEIEAAQQNDEGAPDQAAEGAQREAVAATERQGVVAAHQQGQAAHPERQGVAAAHQRGQAGHPERQGVVAAHQQGQAAPTERPQPATTDRRGPAATDRSDTAAKFLEGFGRMCLIRQFETAMHRLFLAGEIHGTTHLGAGQEAVAVGTCMALGPDDYVAGTYRGHGHALAKGTEPEPLVAEMLGRATGVCRGRAGSMNVVDVEHGLIGCYGIVGGSIAAALGASMSGKRQGRVAVAFFGDGAVNQAYFHECLNMAKVLLLPAIFVCENNFYGEFTPMATVTAGGDIAGRARAYDIPSAVVDGNDLWAVHQAVAAAAERARTDGGPTLLECQTYRHYGHSKSDPAPYRPKAEVEEWLARDPLKLARDRLLRDGITEEQIDRAEAEASALIDQAVAAALAAPYPDPTQDAATEYRP